MLENIIYLGVFFDTQEAKEVLNAYCKPLSRIINDRHTTLLFRPQAGTFNPDIIGEKVAVRVVGYAKEAENEGVRVELSSKNLEVSKLLEKLGHTAHVTLSVSENGKPVNTGKLNFKDVEKSKQFIGTIGYFASDGNVHYTV